MANIKSASVVLRVFPAVALVTVFSTIITLLYEKMGYQLSIGTSLITTISMVISLLIAFRTNTAYERYWEGRRLWSTVNNTVRNFARNMWVQVEEETTEDVLTKKSVINLLVAFAVSTKHYLREEFGYHYADLWTLVQHIPRYSTPASNISLEGQGKLTKKPIIIKLFPCFWDMPEPPKAMEVPGMGVQAPNEESAPSNIPLEITYLLSSYIRRVHLLEQADIATISNLYAIVNTMIECLTGFERIRRTPMPVSYALHLHISVWVYCLSLPFQLVGTLHYVTIVICFIASYVLLGIESIGAEIEDPFGYDPNDLPLDEFCTNKPFTNIGSDAVDLRTTSMDEAHSLLTADGEKKMMSFSPLPRAEADSPHLAAENQDPMVEIPTLQLTPVATRDRRRSRNRDRRGEWTPELEHRSSKSNYFADI
ncbi:uncharacterized protein VTP21DRAFT_10042 [Calcarisporiella thermophila]|uniref:uncharacterized protein n=1 Tax=Calcarisporiella thermophila TaxID=911321 RepID=UPI0037444429